MAAGAPIRLPFSVTGVRRVLQTSYYRLLEAPGMPVFDQAVIVATG